MTCVATPEWIAIHIKPIQALSGCTYTCPIFALHVATGTCWSYCQQEGKADTTCQVHENTFYVIDLPKPTHISFIHANMKVDIKIYKVLNGNKSVIWPLVHPFQAKSSEISFFKSNLFWDILIIRYFIENSQFSHYNLQQDVGSSS